jgi:uncharacterized protein
VSTLDWSLASLILLLGGIIKGGIGFGLPAFSIPFLSLLLGPRDAVVMLSLSACLTNIDNVRRDFSEWRSISRVLPYFAVGIVCVPLGALFLQRGNPELVRLIIGLAVYGYLAVRRFLPDMGEIGATARRGIGVACGLLAGFLSGMANLPGPVSIVYYSMFKFPKNTFIFLVNAFNTLTIGFAIGSYYMGGAYTRPAIIRAMLALVPVYMGFWVGVRIREKIPQEHFFRLVNWGLFGVATTLIVRSVWRFF